VLCRLAYLTLCRSVQLFAPLARRSQSCATGWPRYYRAGPGGKWQTVIASPVWATRVASSLFQTR
jgi:hypothetical protein